MRVAGRANIFARVSAILLRPAQTWDVIGHEPATIRGLYVEFVIPLAALGAICTTVGLIAFGHTVYGVTIRPPILLSLGEALVGFAVTLLGVFLLALVIDGFSTTFHGVPDRVQAFKLAAYSGTPAWVAGVFALVPVLGLAAGMAGSIYGLYILYRGLPKLMRTPEEKTPPYFAVVIVVVILLGLVVAQVEGAVRRMGGPLRVGQAAPAGVTLPGKAEIDLSRIEDAETALKAMKPGQGPPPTDPEAMKPFLPASLEGLMRGDVTGGQDEMAGVKGSSVQATYGKGGHRIKLSITDMGPGGGVVGLVGSFNIRSSQGDADHYEKVGRVDGRITREKYDRKTRSGAYGVLTGGKFMVEARGEGVDVVALKAAVAAVDTAGLEALAEN
jgi:hypothetical protein